MVYKTNSVEIESFLNSNVICIHSTKVVVMQLVAYMHIVSVLILSQAKLPTQET